ncbi:VanZ family protein [Agreia pratensis]|uniref:VanZ like family protein n=1 Tax=Agreia pratensis TaxID=150121 RepID=A0A1X7IZI7_9MICO|nr:VanZ family protein [Agreia pratensis]SMG20576.1 VanZ like family protein [Agreia pratensis]
MNSFSFELAFAALLVVVSIAGVLLVLRRARRGGESRSARLDGICIVVSLTAWLAGLLFMTMRPGSGKGSLLNLVPLSFQGPSAVVDAVLNVGVFIPLGLLLVAAGVRFSVALLIGLLLSVGIELSQYLAQVGRTADVNDLLTNTAGTVLGWAVGAAIVHVRRRADS